MRTREILRKARRDGRDAGRNAASWCFDGNTTDATYRYVLKGLEDGDPAVLDTYSAPNLSGEWADAPTPQSLAEDYDLDTTNDPDSTRLDEACSVWEDAASEAFWKELERTARYYVEAFWKKLERTARYYVTP